jgi:hypothetical protein
MIATSVVKTSSAFGLNDFKTATLLHEADNSSPNTSPLGQEIVFRPQASLHDSFNFASTIVQWEQRPAS